MDLKPTDPRERSEVLHADARTRVTRLSFGGRTVIRKEPLGPDAAARLARETAILERLRGVEGVVQLLDTPRYPGSIVLEDAGGESLAKLAKPFDVLELAELATRLSRTVAAVHARGVLHRDIQPENIVWAREGALCLVDFSRATTLAEIRPEFAHHSGIVGALPYVAPEQTGRTGRSVDHRADLYALGATLYEVATGTPPFGVGEPMRLIHDHLARLPVPPADINPAVPPLVSEIVMHLLEKDPDKRYQTAEGMIHDLTALETAEGVGAHDVPLRLLPPSRLVGRDGEVDALREAFRESLDGRCGGLLVTGAPGVGKTVLIDQLRAVVADTDGWFVTGKFDQYRRDLEFDAGYQAFRALGRLLLAEPEPGLAKLRDRMLQAVGPNAGLLTAVLPEFASLLGVMPDPGDPQTAQARAQRAAVDALRAVAAPERPLVLVMDDLQWTGATPLGFVDLVLSERPIEGLLFVGAYRDGEVDAAHPLAAPLSRWSGQAPIRQLRLGNLSVPALAALVAEILRVDVAAAARLADLLEPHTGGNPYETIELLDAFRREGLLAVTAAGWQCDEAAARARLERSEVGALLGARLAAMPPASQRLVESMACMGGRVELRVLEVASGLPASAAEDALVPALEEGLLVTDPGAHEAVRFRHDRMRDAALRGLGPQQQDILHLELARRLARVPELFAVAAEQYMPVVDAVEGAAEQRNAVALLKRAADQATLIGDHVLVSRLMTAALRLLDPGDTELLVEAHTARHAALVSLGLFEQADEDYSAIAALRHTAPDRPVATPSQVRSLTHRGSLAAANELGIQALRECGIDVPSAAELPVELDRQLETLFLWLNETDESDDLAMPAVMDPRLLTAGRLLDAMLAPTFFIGDLRMYAWVSLEALRIWAEHGPAPTLTGTAANAASQFVAERGDYAAAYRAARRILRVGEARGYQPGTSHARNVFSLLNCWFEPIENAVAESRRAREGLIAGGDLANGGYTLHGTVTGLLDCASSLDEVITAVEEGLAFEQRTGGEQAGRWLNEYQWLVGILRGALPRAAGEAAPVTRHAGNPLALNHVYVSRAVAAAIFGDAESLDRHTAPLPSLASTVVGWSVSALAYPLRGLALAWRLRDSPGDTDLRRELDAVMPWLIARAADAPDNFLHLLHLVEAELGWTRGDFQAAAVNFDAALRATVDRRRPWHRALIAERAARFFLAHGLQQIGYDLLAQAREGYLAWGATAKAAQLDWSPPAGGDTSVVTAGTLDLVGILSASQALSSETSLERLQRRVVEVVSAMTGATGVRLLPWSEERKGWMMPSEERSVPASVLRYVQRTGEPLVVGDAVADQRFGRDPYFAGLDLCSLLAVPVFSRGTLRAALLIENRLIRGAFSADRLDSISLIAGQLAVSLDNAQLYAGFRLMADEQAALRRVATHVARGAPPADVFQAVAEELGRLLGVASSGLVRFDDAESATVVAGWGRLGEVVPVGARLALGGRNAVSEIARTGKPARIDDFAQTASGPIAERANELSTNTSFGGPIMVAGRLWGAMIAATVGGEALPPETEPRLEQFTKLVGTAIANAEARAELQRLADEQAARRRVATLVAKAVPPAQVFDAVVSEVAQLLSASKVGLMRAEGAEEITIIAHRGQDPSLVHAGMRLPLDGASVTAHVIRTGRSERVEGYEENSSTIAGIAHRSKVASTVGAPITVEGRVWGVLTASWEANEPTPADAEERLTQFADLLDTAIGSAHSRDQLTASRARVLTAGDDARRRVVRDIHDGAQQRLVQTSITLKLAQAALGDDPDRAVALLADALAQVEHSNTELRELAHGILPSVLTHGGLRAAVKTVVARIELPVAVEITMERLPPEIEASAYFIVAEALTNVVKHSQASAAEVRVRVDDGLLRIEVCDNGAGGADPSGHGLVGMNDRVLAFGGRLEIESPAGGGTRLFATLPVRNS